MIIKNADLKIFEFMKDEKSLDDRYGYDKNSVYFEGKEIIGADSTTFEILRNDYAKDKNDVYFSGQKLNVDIETFEYTLEGQCFKGKDKKSTYEYGCENVLR